jgi:hypothetical protein
MSAEKECHGCAKYYRDRTRRNSIAGQAASKPTHGVERMAAIHPSRPFATVVAGSALVDEPPGFAYSRRSLTRMSTAGTPSTSASATPGSARAAQAPWTS